MENCANHVDKNGSNICKKCWKHFCENCFDNETQTCHFCLGNPETDRQAQSQLKIPLSIYIIAGVTVFFICFYLLFNLLDPKDKPKIIKHRQQTKSKVFAKNFTSSGNGITVTSESKETADEILNKAKYYRQSLPDSMGIPDYNPSEKLYIKVFPDKKSYTEETGKPFWSEGYADVKKGRIYIVADYEDNSVLIHEMTHLIFESYMGYENSSITWIDEGLAVVQQMKVDSFTKDNIRQHLQRIKNGDNWPINKLGSVDISSTTNENEIDSWYSQCASVVFYLQKKYGMEKFETLLKRLQKKDGFNKALMSTYGTSLNQLQNNWLNDLKTSRSYF